MSLKTVIIIVFIALLMSLASSLVFLFTDKGALDKKRTMYTLGIRVSLAIVLMVLVTYGVMSGKLKSQAPWGHVRPNTTTPLEPSDGTKGVDESTQ